MLFDLRPVTEIKGIGKVKATHMKRLGIQRVQDLLEYYPVRHEDRGPVTPIAALKDKEFGAIEAQVTQISERRARPALLKTAITVKDVSGSAELVWFNQPHIKDRFYVGMWIVVSGQVEKRFGKMQLTKVVWERRLAEAAVGTMLPIYRSTEKLNQIVFRSAIENLLADLSLIETIPQKILTTFGLLSRTESIRAIHFPENSLQLAQAKRRLAFEELYYMQCALLYNKRQQELSLTGIKHDATGELSRKALASLPFTLTEDQNRALASIYADMEATMSMRRLLQGDVGSGKTVLGILALIKTVENGYQGAMMAPTEILAEQHYRTLKELLDPVEIRLALLTGSLSSRDKAAILFNLRTGQVDIVIGTHALIQQDVQFANLGLVITDEQHRFGTNQRSLLEAKGKTPDVLVMSATPIPRTMALTIYGDLDVSTIKQLPPGRKPIKTYSVTRELRHRVYSNLALKEIRAGRQVYVVCPLIDESAEADMQSAVALYEELKMKYMGDITCALFHGRMNSVQREQIMSDFCTGNIKLLVATTVIEVGVNVPNASVMVIEDAHRFGLAQLHQLRGRIGRGEHQSYCVLISNSQLEESQYRLRSMTETQDGFILAERDLLLRGPGDFFGNRQHGMPELKLADLIRDLPLLLHAREAAQLTVTTPDWMETIKPVLNYYFSTWMTGIRG